MADDKKKNEDLTRIEDLAEYIHELNEEDEESEDSFESDDTPPDFDTNLMDAPTDPNIEVPDEFYSGEEFSSEDDDQFEDSFENTSDFEETSDLDFSDNNDDFEFEDSSDFTQDDSETSDFEEETLEMPEEESDLDFSDIGNENEILPEFSDEDTQEESDNFFSEISEVEVKEKTPLIIPKEEPKHSLKVEDFAEVKNFVDKSVFTNYAAEGNPPFSIIIKDIHYLEDINEIIQELITLKLLNEDEIDRARESFMRGSFLVSRIGEFAAISLCHKLRRFNVTTLMGQSSEIHPSSADEKFTSVVSKYSVYQNKQESLNLEEKLIGLEGIVTSTTTTLEGHHIIKYIDIVSEHIVIDMDDFEKSFKLQEELNQNVSDYKARLDLQDESIKEMNEASSVSSPFTKDHLLKAKEKKKSKEVNLNDFYKTLVEKLKQEAISLNANGIVGINFMITPLIKEDVYSRPRYQISATGNAVWAKAL